MPIPGHGTSPTPAPGTPPAAPTPAPGTPPAAPTTPGTPAPPTPTPIRHRVKPYGGWFLFGMCIVFGSLLGLYAVHHPAFRGWIIGGVIGFAVAALVVFLKVIRQETVEEAPAASTPAGPVPAPPATSTPALPARPSYPANPSPTDPAGSWTDPATGDTFYWDLTRWWWWDPASSSWV